jgi:chromosomal replication initiation ATPase DnaA
LIINDGRDWIKPPGLRNLPLNDLQQGRVKKNMPRWVSMCLSQETGSKKLTVIANAFGLKRTDSIPTTVKKLRILLEKDSKLRRKVERTKRVYDT